MTGVVVPVEVDAKDSNKKLDEINKNLKKLGETAADSVGSFKRMFSSKDDKLSESIKQQTHLFKVFGNTAKDTLAATQKGANNTAAAIGNITKAFKSLLTATAAIGAVTVVTKLSDQYTTLVNKLKLVSNETEDLAVLQKTLSDNAEKARSTLQSSVEIYFAFGRALKETGIESERLIKITDLVQKTIAISNTPVESAKAALMQLGQGLAAGALRGEEFNSVAEQIPALAQSIAKGLGVAYGDLRSLAATGALTPDVILGSLEAVSAKINLDFSKTSATISQGTAQLADSLSRLAYEINKVLDINANLYRGLNATANMVNSFSNGISNSLDLVISEMIKYSEAADAMQKNTSVVTQFFNSFVSAIGLSKLLDNVSIALVKIKTTVAALPLTLGIFDTESIDGPITTLEEKIRAVANLLAALFSVMTTTINKAMRVLPTVMGPVLSEADATTVAFTSMFISIESSIASVLVPIKNGLESVSDYLSFFLFADTIVSRAFVNLASSKGISEFTDNLYSLSDAIKHTNNQSITRTFSELQGAFSSLIRYSSRFLQELDVIETDLIYVSNIRFDRLFATLTVVKDALLRIGTDIIIPKYGTQIAKIYEVVAAVAHAYITAISNALEGVKPIQAGKAIGSWLANNLKSLLGSLLNLGKGGILENIIPATKEIEVAVSKIPLVILGFVSGVVEGLNVSGVVTNMLDTATSVIIKYFNGDFGEKLASRIKIGVVDKVAIVAEVVEIFKGANFTSVAASIIKLVNAVFSGLVLSTTSFIRSMLSSSSLSEIVDFVTSVISDIFKSLDAKTFGRVLGNALAFAAITVKRGMSAISTIKFSDFITNNAGDILVSLKNTLAVVLKKLADFIEGFLDGLIGMNPIVRLFTWGYTKQYLNVAIEETLNNAKYAILRKAHALKLNIGSLLSFGSSDGLNDKVFASLSTSLERVKGGLHNVFVSTGMAAGVDQVFQVFSKLADRVASISQKLNTVAVAPIREFATTVVKLFAWIYDKVVGHSYWPDFVDGVIEYAHKIDKALVPIEQFANKVVDKFKSLNSLDSIDFSKAITGMFKNAFGAISKLSEEFLLGVGVTITEIAISMTTFGLPLMVAIIQHLGLVALTKIEYLQKDVAAKVAAIGIAIAQQVVSDTLTALNVLSQTFVKFIPSLVSAILGQFGEIGQGLAIVFSQLPEILQDLLFFALLAQFGVFGNSLKKTFMSYVTLPLLQAAHSMMMLLTTVFTAGNVATGQSAGLVFRRLFGMFNPRLLITAVAATVAGALTSIGAFQAAVTAGIPLVLLAFYGSNPKGVNKLILDTISLFSGAFRTAFRIAPPSNAVSPLNVFFNSMLRSLRQFRVAWRLYSTGAITFDQFTFGLSSKFQSWLTQQLILMQAYVGRKLLDFQIWWNRLLIFVGAGIDWAKNLVGTLAQGLYHAVTFAFSKSIPVIVTYLQELGRKIGRALSGPLSNMWFAVINPLQTATQWVAPLAVSLGTNLRKAILMARVFAVDAFYMLSAWLAANFTASMAKYIAMASGGALVLYALFGGVAHAATDSVSSVVGLADAFANFAVSALVAAAALRVFLSLRNIVKDVLQGATLMDAFLAERAAGKARFARLTANISSLATAFVDGIKKLFQLMDNIFMRLINANWAAVGSAISAAFTSVAKVAQNFIGVLKNLQPQVVATIRTLGLFLIRLLSIKGALIAAGVAAVGFSLYSIIFGETDSFISNLGIAAHKFAYFIGLVKTAPKLGIQNSLEGTLSKVEKIGDGVFKFNRELSTVNFADMPVKEQSILAQQTKSNVDKILALKQIRDDNGELSKAQLEEMKKLFEQQQQLFEKLPQIKDSFKLDKVSEALTRASKDSMQSTTTLITNIFRNFADTITGLPVNQFGENIVVAMGQGISNGLSTAWDAIGSAYRKVMPQFLQTAVTPTDEVRKVVGTLEDEIGKINPVARDPGMWTTFLENTFSKPATIIFSSIRKELSDVFAPNQLNSALLQDAARGVEKAKETSRFFPKGSFESQTVEAAKLVNLIEQYKNSVSRTIPEQAELKRQVEAQAAKVRDMADSYNAMAEAQKSLIEDSHVQMVNYEGIRKFIAGTDKFIQSQKDSWGPEQFLPVVLNSLGWEDFAKDYGIALSGALTEGGVVALQKLKAEDKLIRDYLSNTPLGSKKGVILRFDIQGIDKAKKAIAELDASMALLGGSVSEVAKELGVLDERQLELIRESDVKLYERLNKLTFDILTKRIVIANTPVAEAGKLEELNRDLEALLKEKTFLVNTELLPRIPEGTMKDLNKKLEELNPDFEFKFTKELLKANPEMATLVKAVWSLNEEAKKLQLGKQLEAAAKQGERVVEAMRNLKQQAEDKVADKPGELATALGVKDFSLKRNPAFMKEAQEVYKDLLLARRAAAATGLSDVSNAANAEYLAAAERRASTFAEALNNVESPDKAAVKDAKTYSEAFDKQMKSSGLKGLDFSEYAGLGSVNKEKVDKIIRDATGYNAVVENVPPGDINFKGKEVVNSIAMIERLNKELQNTIALDKLRYRTFNDMMSSMGEVFEGFSISDWFRLDPGVLDGFIKLDNRIQKLKLDNRPLKDMRREDIEKVARELRDIERERRQNKYNNAGYGTMMEQSGIDPQVYNRVSEEARNRIFQLQNLIAESEIERKTATGVNLSLLQQTIEESKIALDNAMLEAFSDMPFEASKAALRQAGVSFGTELGKLSNEQLKAVTQLSAKIRAVAYVAATTNDEDIRQAATALVEDATEKMNAFIKTAQTDLMKEAGTKFAESTTSGFTEGFSALFKSEKTVKEFLLDQVDRFTKGVLDAFLEGLTAPLTDENGPVKTWLKEQGKALFQLGAQAFGYVAPTAVKPTATADTPWLIKMSATLDSILLAVGGGQAMSTLGYLRGFGSESLGRQALSGSSGVFGKDVFSTGFDSLWKSNSAKEMTSVVSTGFDEVFKGITDSTKDFGDSMVDITSTLGSDFSGVTDSIGSIFKMGFSFISSMFADGGIVSYAGGGRIRGAGTGRSDSILARVSNGEYIVNAAKTAMYKPLLDAINYGSGIPAFANGGMYGQTALQSAVDQRDAEMSSNARVEQTFHVNVTGDVSRQTRNEIRQMIPEIAMGANIYNKEKNYR